MMQQLLQAEILKVSHCRSGNGFDFASLGTKGAYKLLTQNLSIACRRNTIFGLVYCFTVV